MRLIPGKTKIKIELFKSVTLADMVVGGLFALLLLLVVLSSLPGKLIFCGVILFVAVLLLVRLDTEPNYKYLLHILRHYSYRRNYDRQFTDEILLRKSEVGQNRAVFESVFSKKRKKSEAEKPQKKTKKPNSGASYDVERIMGFTDVKDDLIHYNGQYYGAVLEIDPVEFRFLSPVRRSNSIDHAVAGVLRSIPMQYAANIVKIERPIRYDECIENEYTKLEALRQSYEKGVITEPELQARVEILYDRINDLRRINMDDKVIQPCYYLVFFDSDRQRLNNFVSNAINELQAGEIYGKRLNTKELAVFLKYTNCLDFDERDIEKLAPEDYAPWAMPQTVAMRPRTTAINGILTHNMRVVGYPTATDDAWLASVMSLPATKVVVKCTPMDRAKAIRSIDRSLSELRGQYMNTGVDSRRIELQTHIDSLSELLATLQGDNETLLEVNVYITAYDINLTRRVVPERLQPPPSELSNISEFKRLLRQVYSKQGLRLNSMEFNQVNAFIGGQISGYDPMAGDGRGIPAATVAAMYPWVFAHVMDAKGVKLGSEAGIPVFVDFFRRDSQRVNSNMVIIGKSGSGKSYATKSFLANLAADDSKIFILDPENEYTELAENLHGKTINVGNPIFGRLNPFHIITALDDDEGGGETVSGSYATHLQFLEEFFRQIMPDCEKDAMEYLNSIVDRMYTNMGITPETDLHLLRPQDYPVFDDLYDCVLAEFQSTDNEYIRTMLRTLMNYISKFSTGGRNSNLWNGASTVTTEENFTVFNFQSLLANRNNTIANAQMLLVLKYVDNEIIKNRDYNRRYGTNRKIVVVIDEAHVFIDTKFPVALDFMFQLAKRIRKYNGMQIVITQNIKDFVGSEEIARKSTAIINACQYSFIFSLAPNDMDDLCKLYEKAGGINESEQEQIVSAPRGQAFTILGPQTHSTFRVEAPGDIAAMFQESDFVSNYFTGEEGEANWEDFMGESRSKRELVRSVSETVEQVQQNEKGTGKPSIFQEISEEEYDAMQAAPVPIPAETPRYSAPAEPAPQPITVTPQVVVQAPEPSRETEKRLTDFLEKFTYESMMQEIRRSVQEEIGHLSTAPVQEDTSLFDPELELDPELDLELEEKQEFDDDTAAALGDILDGLDLPSADEPEEQKAETPEYDIMAILAKETEYMDEVSPIELMETYDEQIIEVSIEELSQYISNMKKARGNSYDY